ncbi:Glycosyltransferase AglD [Candidatus Norongarragalina meridionalis]|nr:Glycosyltransferase AglD [Candidatus Norongarragalina meridionalis]
MTLTILIPTHNEEGRIGVTLRKLNAFLKKSKLRASVLVVDDGNDRTAFISRSLGAKVIHFPKRLGKGDGVHAGLKQAKGDVVVYDADASTPPEEIPRLVAALSNADVAIGSRYSPASNAQMPLSRKITGRSFNLLVRVLFGMPFSDTQCGFKAIREKANARIAPQLRETGFVWDVEFLAIAIRNGMRIEEVPIRWKHVTGGPTAAGGIIGLLKTALRMLSDVVALRLRL